MVILLMCLVWVVGIYDLPMTVYAARIDGFTELNPLARQLLHSPPALTAFKFGLMFPATLVFLAYRRYIFTEIGCWLLAGIYVGLALLWKASFMHA